MLKLCVTFVGVALAPLFAWLLVPALACLAVLAAAAIPVALLVYGYLMLKAPRLALANLEIIPLVLGGGVPIAHDVSARSAVRAA
jgi:hypothetical protein